MYIRRSDAVAGFDPLSYPVMMDTRTSELASLRRTVRYQQYATLALGVVLGTLLLSSALAQKEQELKLQKLTIVNGEDHALISFGVGEDGRAQIVMHADEERDSLWIGTTEHGHAAIDLFNKNGDPIVSLGGTKEGHGGVRVESEDTTPAFYMGRDLRGNGRVPSNVHAGRRLD